MNTSDYFAFDYFLLFPEIFFTKVSIADYQKICETQWSSIFLFSWLIKKNENQFTVSTFEVIF